MTARTAIATLLRNDDALRLLLAGGVWERPLVLGPREELGGTPGAFDEHSRVLPSAVVSIFGVGQSFAGTSLVGQLGGSTPVLSRTATVNLYQARPWRDVIEAALGRIEELLHGKQFMTDDLGCIVVRYTGNIGDNPGDDDLSAELERANLSISNMRRVL